MTVEDFNEKWNYYLSEGHYGLDIDNKDVIEFLDDIFESWLTHLPNFEYQQIKTKFGEVRFYFSADIPREEYIEINMALEESIQSILDSSKGE